MQNNIRNTNLRFNLDKEQQRRAWEYLQTMDRQDHPASRQRNYESEEYETLWQDLQKKQPLPDFSSGVMSVLENLFLQAALPMPFWKKAFLYWWPTFPGFWIPLPECILKTESSVWSIRKWCFLQWLHRNRMTGNNSGMLWKKTKRPKTADWQENLLSHSPLSWIKTAIFLFFRILLKRIL